MTITELTTIDKTATIGTLNKNYNAIVAKLGDPNIHEEIIDKKPIIAVKHNETPTTDKQLSLTRDSWAFEDNLNRKGYIWPRNIRINLKLNTLWNVNGDIDMLQELFNKEIVELI